MRKKPEETEEINDGPVEAQAVTSTPTPTQKPYTFKRILRHTFTGKDNKTVDMGRVLWGLGALAFIGISIYFVLHTGQWNPLEWGSGFAVINGGSGAAVKMKESSEP